LAPSMREIVTIDSLGHRGDGIAKGYDRPLYAPFRLPGQRVAVERDGDRARLVPVDQFVYSAETEVVGLFRRGDK
jgi:tRNA/tmRNA/rRNA uracil-C5-methylase (TrmA/RlmC/RlmD family)